MELLIVLAFIAGPLALLFGADSRTNEPRR
jgi:hypothetical protein